MIDLNSVRAVAVQDLLDVRRARLLQAVFAGYVLFVGAIFLGVSMTSGSSVRGAIQLTMLIGFLFIPLVALLSGYLSIAGERESGTIRFLIGYPLRRSEVILGKTITRLGVVFMAVGVAFLGSGVIAALQFDAPRLDQLAIFAGTTALFAGAYVGMAVGVSGASGSRSRAMSGTVGTYFLFTLLWSKISPVTVPGLIETLADSLLGVTLGGPLWDLFSILSPAEAYFWSLQLLPGEAFRMTAAPVDGVGVLAILIGWIVVPPALGCISFRRADIT